MRAARRLVALSCLAVLATVPATGVAVAATPALAKTAAPRAAPVAGARPNILFILVDDMGYGDLSVTGNRKVETPNIDRLASQGVLMTRFYDASPICSSSRAAFLTGRFPAEVGFVGITDSRARNAAIGQADWLDPALPTTARMLRSVGYATAHIGKWHLGGGRDIGDAPWPTAYGFGESFTNFEGLGPRVLMIDHQNNLSRQSEALGQGPVQWAYKRALTPLYCDKTIDFVTRNKDRPWFVQLWLNDVHDIWAAAAEDVAAVRGKGADAADERFLAALVGMDRALGGLFDRLEQTGEASNTLIVLTSDNGPSSVKQYYDGGATPPGSTAGLRGRKFSLYEGGIRQPLIVRWPARVVAGRRDDRTVTQAVDFMATFAILAGAKVPAGTDGVDISSAIAGRPIDRRPALFWAYGREGRAAQPAIPHDLRDVSPRFAIRDGDWKLLANAGGADAQLYNVSRDPDESDDLAGRQPAVRDRLLARLRGWMASLAK